MSEPQQPYGPPPGYGPAGQQPGQPPGQQPDPVPGWPPASPPGAPAASGWPTAPAGSGWGAAPGQPAPYGPGAPWTGPQETSSRAIIALVLALGSYVVLPFLSAIAGLVVASSAVREIDASGGRLSGRGLATAAKVLSWLNIALCVLAVVLLVALVSLFATSGSS